LSAIIVAGIVAIAPSQIYYSQQVREYSFTFFLAFGMIYVLWNYIESPTPSRLVVLSIVWAIGVWTQYGLSLLALSLNLGFLIINKNNIKGVIQWLAGQIPIITSVVLIYLLGLQTQYVPGGSGIQYLAVGYWDSAAMSAWIFIVKQTLDILNFSFPDGILFPAILLLGLVTSACTTQKKYLTVLILMPFGIAISLGLLRMYPYLGTRHNIYLTPLIFILVGLGLDYIYSLEREKIIGSILLLCMLIGGIKADLDYYKSPGVENIRPIVSNLKSIIRDDDRVYVYYGAEWAFRYYVRDFQIDWSAGKWHRNSPELYRTEIEPLVTSSTRLWVVFSHCYLDECIQIRDYVSTLRPIQLVAEDSDVFLYLVD